MYSDLETVEFLSAKEVQQNGDATADEASDSVYPFSAMLRGSAGYIADHRDNVAVFNIPGELLERPEFSNLMGDIALSWMLGLKIVIVVTGRFHVDCCNLGYQHPHECYNSLRDVDEELLKKMEEESGYIRFEVERVLNRHLRTHAGMSPTNPDAPQLNGNVVGGNFYMSRTFGRVGEKEYKHTGYPCSVFADRISQVLGNNDVVLLTTVSMNRLGDVVQVNGEHLAAEVASAMNARKLVYLSTKDYVLRKQGASKTMQEIPLGFAKSLLHHHNIQMHDAGIASFDHVKDTLEPGAVELLLHLGWATRALERGNVNRAHIVNPGDGSLLEELFTSKNGINTCLYLEGRADDLDLDEDQDDLTQFLAMQ